MARLVISNKTPGRIISNKKRTLIGTNMVRHLTPNESELFRRAANKEVTHLQKLRLAHEISIESRGAHSEEARISKLSLLQSEITLHDKLRQIIMEKIRKIAKNKLGEKEQIEVDELIDRINDHSLKMAELEEETTYLKEKLTTKKAK